MKDNILVYICDDDSAFARKIGKIIESYSLDMYQCKVEIFSNGKSLITAWNEKMADVVFLDTDMPGLDGFDVAKKLGDCSKRVLIVFISSHDEDVYRIWEYRPFWFLRKSHTDELVNIMASIYSEIRNRRENSENTCILKADNCVVEIKLDRLETIESSNHNIIITYSNKTKSEIRCRLNSAEEQLHKHQVVRVQRGILVNFRFIYKIIGKEIHLMSGRVIPIGRDRMAYVKGEYHKFLNNRM